LSIQAKQVLEAHSKLFLGRGLPDHIRSDNSAEFTATKLQNWLEKLGVKTAFMQ